MAVPITRLNYTGVDRRGDAMAVKSTFPSVIIPTYSRSPGMASFSKRETDSMVVIDALLIVAMLFFLFLPITDRKTVRMKLFVLCAIAAVLAVSVTWTPAPDLQLASVARER